MSLIEFSAALEESGRALEGISGHLFAFEPHSEQITAGRDPIFADVTARCLAS